MDVTFLKQALFNGTTANAFKLGTALTGGWFWVRVSGCSILYRGEDLNAIDFNIILAVVNTSRIQPPPYIRHDANSVHFYLVRRANAFGMLEQTYSAAVKVEIDADGNLTSSRPNGIFGLTAEQLAAGCAQLAWFYCALDRKSNPASFKIYSDGATGRVDYGNPLATVKYQGRRFYSFKTAPLDAGTYLFTVKTEDKTAAKSPPAEITVQISGEISETITILEARAI